MKRILAFFLILTLSVGVLCGCRETVDFRDHLDAYVKTLPYRDGFTVLQLTDIHWSSGTEVGDEAYGSERYLTKVIREAESHAGKIDLIEITGDTFMLIGKEGVLRFIDFIESFEIPYAIVWGNHDRSGLYRPEFLSEVFGNAEHSLYTEVDHDNVHERSNYVINLTDDANQTVFQIFNLDSGASYRSGAKDLFLTYDYLRDDQFDWLTAEHESVGTNPPGFCFYHIPQADNDIAYEALQNGAPLTNQFQKQEGFAASDYARATAQIFSQNNIRGVFTGHDHANDWVFTEPSTGIVYGYGVKSTDELYYGEITEGDDTFPMTGAALITITARDGSFTLEHLYLNERKNAEDLIRWVTYGD